MESKNLLTLAITLTVGIILAGSLLMPVISDATETERTFVNEGYYYMTDLGEDTYTYAFDGTTWTVNDEEVEMTISDATTVIAGEDVIVRANGGIRGKLNTNAASLSLTVTASGFTGTVTLANDTTQSVNVSAEIYYIAVSEKTSHVLSKYNVPTYLHEDSEILADGFSGFTTSASSVFRIEGSIEDGFTVTPQQSGITVSDVVCNYSKVDGFIDLYKVDSITFNSIYDNGTSDDDTDDVVRAQTYSSYIVESSVTAERSEHLNPGEIAIMNALPVLIIVALVMMAAGALFLKRDD